MNWIINQLNRITSLSGSDLFPVWTTKDGTVAISFDALVDAINSASESGSSGIITQYSSPQASGFSVSIQDNFKTWLLMTPNADYAAGTFVLPSLPADQQTLEVSITKNITTVTWDANGKSINSAPATLNAGDAFSLRYDAISQTWYLAP